MTTSIFNPITYANKLKDAGMAIRVADVQAEEMSNFMSSNLVTKEDLKKELQLLEVRLQTFMMKSLLGAIAILATLQTLLGHFMG